MKITVLAGSPKGQAGVTMQYVRFLQQRLPGHDVEVCQISQSIKKIETDPHAFEEVIDAVASSDAVLWAFPVYYFLVPSQYKRFIELIGERKAQGAFQGKFAAVLTTSIHFFDHTAHEYMRAVCDDLGMSFAGAFSAEMYDLTREEPRQRFRDFIAALEETVRRGLPVPRMFPALGTVEFEYRPGPVDQPVDPGGKRVVILHDAGPKQANLRGMILRLKDSFGGRAEVLDLNEVDIRAGCQGCLRCGQANECCFTEKDGYVEFFNGKVANADIVILAGSIVDRYLSSRWKLFFDRAFFNTHIPRMEGKQLAAVISGRLGALENLRHILQGCADVQRAHLVDFVTDETADSGLLDARLSALAERLVWFSNRDYVPPPTFLGVAGRKLFRDEVYSRLRPVFQADHRYYKKHGWYDFPQKQIGLRMLNPVLSLLFRVPSLRRAFDNRVNTEMVRPLERVVEAERGGGD